MTLDISTHHCTGGLYSVSNKACHSPFSNRDIKVYLYKRGRFASISSCELSVGRRGDMSPKQVHSKNSQACQPNSDIKCPRSLVQDSLKIRLQPTKTPSRKIFHVKKKYTVSFYIMLYCIKRVKTSWTYGRNFLISIDHNH